MLLLFLLFVEKIIVGEEAVTAARGGMGEGKENDMYWSILNIVVNVKHILPRL